MFRDFLLVTKDRIDRGHRDVMVQVGSDRMKVEQVVDEAMIFGANRIGSGTILR